MNLQRKTRTLVILILLLSGAGAIYSYKFFHLSGKDDSTRNENKNNLANNSAALVKSMTAPIKSGETEEEPMKEEQKKQLQQAQISISASPSPPIANLASRDNAQSNDDIIKSMSARK